jgi:hypothetical protein
MNKLNNKLILILVISAFLFILISIVIILFLIIKIFMVGGEAIQFPPKKKS